MRCAGAASAMQVVGAVLMWLSSSLLTPVSPAPQQLAAQPRNMGREPRYKRVCYYTNWSQYRKNGGRFLPANIDPFLCTHIVFAFAKLDHKGQLAPYEWNDVQYPYLYRQFTSLKKRNPELKALLAVGGWTLGSGPFSRMAGSKEGRRNFVEHALQYLRTHHFDGLDLDWEYPANRGSPPEDKDNFSLLLKDLREAFEEEASRTGKTCLILAAAVSVGEKIVVTAYDVPKLNKYLDFINLMSYDLHGSWSKFLGHNAPLYGGNYNTGEPTLTHSVDDAVRLWLRLGASRDKLVMGIPFYGRSFTTCKQKVKPGQRNCGVGKPAPFTKEKGFVSYYEMQSYLKNGWKRVWLEKEKVPYAYDLKTNQWVGYDDIESVQYKAEYIREQGLGGAMFWALDLDDFGGLHSDTANPLARTVRSLLAGDEEFPEFNVPGKKLKKPGLRIRGNRKSPKPTPPSKKPPAYLKRPIKNPKDNVKNLLKNHIKTQKNPKDYVKNLKDHGNQLDTKFLPAGQDQMDKPEHDSPLSGLPKSLSGMNRATKSPGTSTPSSTSKVTARRNPAPWAPVRPEIVGSVKSPFTKPMGQGRRTTARTTPMPWSKNARKMVKQNAAEKSKAAGYTVKTTVKPVSVVKSKKNSYTVFNPFLKFKPQFLTTRLPQTTAATTTTTVATSTATPTPSSTRTSTAKTSTTKRAATTTRLSTSSPVSKATSTQAPATTKTTASTTSPSTSTSSTTKSSTVPSTTTAIPSTSTSAVTSPRKQTTKNKSVLSDVTTTATPSPSSTVPPGSRWWGKNAEKAIQGPKTKADEYEVKNEKSQPSYTVESSETKKINKNKPVYTVKSSHKEGSPDVQVKAKESSSIYRTKSSDQQKISKTESEGRVKESPFKKPVAQKEGKVTRPKLTPAPSTRPTSTSSYTTTPSYVPTTSTSSSLARTSSTTSGPARITSKQATDSTTTSTAPTTTTVSSTTRATSATATKASSSHKAKSGRSKWLFETTKPTTTTTAPADITAKHSAGTTSSVRGQPPNRKPYPKSPFTKPAKLHTKSASDALGKKKDNPESLLKDLKGQVRMTKPVTSTTTEASAKTTTTTPKPTTSTDTATTTHPRLSTSTTQTAKMTTTSGVKPTPRTKILSFNLKSRDSLHKSENLIRGQNAEHKENTDSKRTQSNALRHDESRAGKGRSQADPKETGSAPKKSVLSQTLKLPDYSQDPRRRQPTKSIFSGMVGKSSPSSSTPTRTRTTIAGTTAASTAPPTTTSRVTTTTRNSSAKISTRPTPKARQWQRETVASVKQNLSDKTFTKMSSEPKGVTPKTSITTSRNPTSTTTQSQHDTTSHTKPTTRRATVSVTPGFKSTARIPQATKYKKNRGDLTVQAYKNLLKSSTVGGTRKASTTQATTTVTSLNKKTPTAKMTHRQSSSATKATPTPKVTDAVSTSILKVPNTEKSAVPDSKKKGDKSQTSSLKTTIPSTSTKKVTLPPARAEATRPSTPSRMSTHARTTSTSAPPKEAVTGRRTARPVRPPPLARRPSENEADPFRWLGVSRFTTQPPTPPRRQEEDPNIRIRMKNPFRAPSKHLQGVAPAYGGVAQRVQADRGSLKTDGMPGLGSELRWWEKAAEPKDRQWWGMGQAARASMGSFSRKTFPDWRQHKVVTRPSASSRAPSRKSSQDCDKDSDAEQFKATGMQPESMRAGVEVSYEVREPSTSPPRFETLPEEKMPLQSEYQPEYQPHFSYSPTQFEFECPTVFGIYSDPQDCHRFYQCVWLVAFHHVCGPGTVWNDEMKICDWPSASSCRS